jgi:hypothetical protein
MPKTWRAFLLLAFLSPVGLVLLSTGALAKCKTTLECAQQAVEAAAQAVAAVTVAQGRIEKLEKTVLTLSDGLGAGRILAMIEVKNGAVVYKSAGVTFDSGTGKITFENKSNLKPVPLYSYISPNGVYATESIFSRVIANDYIIAWQGAQDTSGRNHPPLDFTAVVVGF